MHRRTITAVGPSALAAYLAFAVLWPITLAAAPDKSTVVFEPNSLPQKVSPLGASYSDKARRLGLTGRSCLAYSVDTGGRPQNISVLESAGAVLDDHAKKLLSALQFDVPTDWAATGGPAKRYRIGYIFELSNKPKVPPFEEGIPTVVIRATGIAGA
jgi:TonB family protein